MPLAVHPRSSSTTSTSAHPSCRARSTSAYCSRWLSRLTRRRLANIHASPLGQLISAYFVHRSPPHPSPSQALSSTASVRGLLAVLPPSEVAVRGRNCCPRIV